MKCIFSLLVLIFLLSSVNPAYPYWIWTPKTGKWVNPKYAVRPTPKEQLEYAQTIYNDKKYKEARREFQRLIQYYPKSAEAAEAQYYLGLSEEREDNPYAAYLAYQKVIDKYPFSQRIQEIIEKEYKIAESFMAGKTRKALGINLPVENPAIEIFRKVVDNSTYGPLAASAQYKLGLVLKGLGRYFEAEEEFQKVIANYPKSEWIDAAKFQIASCRASLSRSPDYDQEATKEAKNKFEEFVKEHPDAALSRDAEDNIQKLQEKEAESAFTTGRFYEKQKIYQSARIYYDYVIGNYPKSIWAAKSLERLQAMERKKK
jgi:outer membrane protein assembly factor BamD